MKPETHESNGLSDEQFCALLMDGQAGSASAQAEAEEAAKLRAALASYRTESLLWAERRSATMPSLTPVAKRYGLWAAVPRWSLAAVAVMTVGVAAMHFQTGRVQTDAGDAPATVTEAMDGAATPQQIDQDNALLGSIDAAVNAGAGLPVSALGLETPRVADSGRRSME